MMPVRYRLAAMAAILSIALPAAGTPALAGDLRVSVAGVRNGTGTVRVALYKTPDGFATAAGRFMEIVIPAHTGTVAGTFRAVPEGTYGLAAFHDENANVAFDANFIGIPKEGFGFGNDAPVSFGPPDFEDAAVTVAGRPGHVTLTLRYW